MFQLPKIVETYKGVDITLSCGYYYPSVNGNVERLTIDEVKKWIDDVWLFYVESMQIINTHVMGKHNN